MNIFKYINFYRNRDCVKNNYICIHFIYLFIQYGHESYNIVVIYEHYLQNIINWLILLFAFNNHTFNIMMKKT